MIELRQLQHFVAVVEAGGFRKAARQIHLSPSSITRSIQLLESHFEVSLFDREEGGMHLTPFGTKLLEDARAVLSGVEAMAPRLAQVEELATGHLEIGMSPAVADLLLPAVAARLVDSFPSVSLSTRLGITTDTLPWLLAHEIEVAVGYDRDFHLEKNCHVIPLYEDRVRWFVRKGHPILKKRQGSLLDLARYPVVMQHMPPLYSEWLRSIEMAVISLKPDENLKIAHRCSDYNLLRRMTLQSDAIMVATELGITRGPDAEHLRMVSLPFNPPDVTVVAAHLRTPNPSPLACKFIEYLEDGVRCFQQPGDWESAFPKAGTSRTDT